MRRNASLTTGATLLIACALLLGCHGIGKRKAGNPVSPITGEIAPLSPPASFNKKLTERELCMETARAVAEKGYAEEAIKLYEKAERLEPESEPLDLQLAPLYAHVGDIQKSVARYENVIDRGRATSDVYNNLAWTQMESRRYEDAIATVERGLAGEPENQRLKATLAVTHYRQGDRDKCFAKFEEAFGSSAAHHNVAVLDLDAGDVDSAIKHSQLAAASADAKEGISAFLEKRKPHWTSWRCRSRPKTHGTRPPMTVSPRRALLATTSSST